MYCFNGAAQVLGQQLAHFPLQRGRAQLSAEGQLGQGRELFADSSGARRHCVMGLYAVSEIAWTLRLQ